MIQSESVWKMILMLWKCHWYISSIDLNSHTVEHQRLKWNSLWVEIEWLMMNYQRSDICFDDRMTESVNDRTNASLTHSHDALRISISCHSWHIRNIRITKRNQSGYGSQQIVSVRGIRDVRGARFWLSKNLQRMPRITLYSQRGVLIRVDSCWFVVVRNRAWQHS